MARVLGELRGWGKVILVVLAVALIGSTQSGVQVHVIDVGGAHTGTIYAVMNTAAQLPGVAAPSIVGYYVQRFGSASGYAIVFWIAIALYVGGTAAFALASRARTRHS